MASSLTQTGLAVHNTNPRIATGDMVVLSLVWTAHTDGVFTTTAISARNMNHIKGLWLDRVVTKPGSTAPTSQYNVTLLGPDSEDIVDGALKDRDAVSSEQELAGDAFTRVRIPPSLSLAISGNSVNSATGTVTLYCSR